MFTDNPVLRQQQFGKTDEVFEESACSFVLN